MHSASRQQKRGQRMTREASAPLLEVATWILSIFHCQNSVTGPCIDATGARKHRTCRSHLMEGETTRVSTLRDSPCATTESYRVNTSSLKRKQLLVNTTTEIRKHKRGSILKTVQNAFSLKAYRVMCASPVGKRACCYRKNKVCSASPV